MTITISGNITMGDKSKNTNKHYEISLDKNQRN